MTMGLCSDRSPWGQAFPAPHRALTVPPPVTTPPQGATKPLGLCSHWSPWYASGTKDAVGCQCLSDEPIIGRGADPGLALSPARQASVPSQKLCLG